MSASSYSRLDSVGQEAVEVTIIYQFIHSVSPLEREMEVMDITARKRVLGDPDMLDTIFIHLIIRL